jgi:hypothetical protein
MLRQIGQGAECWKLQVTLPGNTNCQRVNVGKCSLAGASCW